MKQLIIALILLVIILAFGIYDHVRIEHTFEEFDRKLTMLDGLIRSGNTAEALNVCNELMDWWENKRHYVETFSYSPDTRMLSVTLGEIEGSLIADDLKNAQSKSSSMFLLLHNVHHTLDFDLADIL